MKQLSIKMDFSNALHHLKDGKLMSRESWTEKNLFVFLEPGYPNGVQCSKQLSSIIKINTGDAVMINPYFHMKTADGSYSVWNPSTEDILAEDWIIITK